MDRIREAVERARANLGSDSQTTAVGPQPPRHANGWMTGRREPADGGSDEVVASSTHLEANRIVAHNGTDPRAKPYDMLRTQVLQTMDLKGWKTLAVTSPTPGCGKTLTAINLALSIGRLPERSVLLIDMDLLRPQVAKYCGLSCDAGLVGVLEGHLAWQHAMVPVRAGSSHATVLPTVPAPSGSSEWMASRAISTILQDVKRSHQSEIVIIDMPPMLCTDDVIAVLPQIDCVLLVAAVGTSTVAEIKECNRHLQSTDVVRVVLNKVAEASTAYYY